MMLVCVDTDDTKLNVKGCEVNFHLKVLCEEKNVYLIDNYERIKLKHLNKGKLHLNKNSSNILSNTLIDENFNWQSERYNPDAVPGECIFNKMLSPRISSWAS